MAGPKTSSKRRTYTSKSATIDFEDYSDKRVNDHLTMYKIPKNRPVRIYCDGIYDLFHYGHARSLQQAKLLFPNVQLLVGVSTDKDTLSRKGRTVLSHAERIESVRHCKWVDEVIADPPWMITLEFIEAHKIDFVAHDDTPYPGEGRNEDLYGWLKREGKFIATKRTFAISTSDLITRVLQDYDIFVQRNLERGISPKQLNLSVVKRGEIEVKQLQSKLTRELKKQKELVKGNWSSSAQECVLALQKARSNFINDFASLFDLINRRKSSK